MTDLSVTTALVFLPADLPTSWSEATERGSFVPGLESVAAWHGVVVAVYGQTRSFPEEEIYGLTSQMRQSAISVPSNIAEGKGRSTDRDRSLFFCHARGSLLELETQILLAQQLKYVVPSEAEKLMTKSTQLGRMLNALIHSLKNPGNSEKSAA